MKLLRKILDRLYVVIFTNNAVSRRKYLINKGAIIGEGTRILTKVTEISEPYLIEIGRNSLISSNVSLLTHDGGMMVLNNLGYFKRKADKVGRISIGDNVFLGHKSIIMPGVVIGNNSIVAAGSIVTKDIPPNSIYAGIPAKYLMNINEYYNKNKDNIHFTVGMEYREKREYYDKIFK